MKRLSLAVLVLGLASLGSSLLFSQPKSAPATPPKATQKMVRVATIKGAEANREFQANVQLLQAQRQAAADLSEVIKKETDAKKKKELQTQLDQLVAKLNENNAKMQKTYGFSLTRNYTLEIETANIYLLVSDEEAAKIEQAQKKKK